MKTWLIVILLFTVALSACMPSVSAGSEIDTATALTSDNGRFKVSYRSELEPAEINQLHSWVLHVEDASGQPLENATINVKGWMPDHGHGLPTAPRVTEALGNGDYRLEGIKYSMPGHWEMTVEIQAGDQTDSVTFNLNLP